MTRRHHNLDADVVTKLNQVTRGTANYFATTFSHCSALFRTLDRWLRMRLRAMKYKRKSCADNGRYSTDRFCRQGLLFLGDLMSDPA